MSTYWGRPEIFWTAWETIGTLIAVIITFALVLLNWLWPKLHCPNIVASNFNLEFHQVLKPNLLSVNAQYTGIQTSSWKGTVKITWNIFNKPRFIFIGAHAFDIKTHVRFNKKGATIGHYNKTIAPVTILPKRDSLKQFVEFNYDNLEPGEYEVFIHFTSEERVIGKKKRVLMYDPPALPEDS